MEEDQIHDSVEDSNDLDQPNQETETPNVPEKPQVSARKKAEERALKDELNKYKQLVKDLETKALTEKEDFKSLAERRQQERDDLQHELEKTRKAFQTEFKSQALREAAIKAGLRDAKDLDLLNLDDILVEVTSEGRMLLHGVEDFVSDLKAGRPHWFQDKTGPKFNGGGTSRGTAGSEELTPQKLVALERQLRAQGKLKEIKDLYESYNKQKRLKLKA